MSTEEAGQQHYTHSLDRIATTINSNTLVPTINKRRIYFSTCYKKGEEKSY